MDAALRGRTDHLVVSGGSLQRAVVSVNAAPPVTLANLHLFVHLDLLEALQWMWCRRQPQCLPNLLESYLRVLGPTRATLTWPPHGATRRLCGPGLRKLGQDSFLSQTLFYLDFNCLSSCLRIFPQCIIFAALVFKFSYFLKRHSASKGAKCTVLAGIFVMFVIDIDWKRT